jgi:hypothetical protein
MLESIKDLVGRTWRKGTRYAVNWLEDDGLDEPTAPADMARGVETNPYRAFESLSHSLPHIAYSEEEACFCWSPLRNSPRQSTPPGLRLSHSPWS